MRERDLLDLVDALAENPANDKVHDQIRQSIQCLYDALRDLMLASGNSCQCAPPEIVRCRYHRAYDAALSALPDMASGKETDSRVSVPADNCSCGVSAGQHAETCMEYPKVIGDRPRNIYYGTVKLAKSGANTDATPESLELIPKEEKPLDPSTGEPPETRPEEMEARAMIPTLRGPCGACGTYWQTGENTCPTCRPQQPPPDPRYIMYMTVTLRLEGLGEEVSDKASAISEAIKRQYGDQIVSIIKRRRRGSHTDYL